MSKSEDKASGAAQGEQKSNSVYDFLYHDPQRIGSFLAQFDDAGHLQQITQSESVGKQAHRGYKFNIGGGAAVLGTGGQGNLGVERSPSEIGTEGTQRIYDPNWTNALALLDFLEEHELIQKDIMVARIGQLIIILGELSIIDTILLRKVFELPVIRSAFMTHIEAAVKLQIAKQTENVSQSSQQNVETTSYQMPQTPSIDQAQKEFGILMEILPLLPHGVQANLNGDGYSVWCSLDPSGLTGTVADISLKHGYSIPGTWHVMGILDALPGPIPSPIIMPLLPYGEVGPYNLVTLAKNYSIIARQALGRPAGAFGVTPFLIFRKVSSN